MNTENLLQTITKTVKSLYPKAQIILYGSRARETAKEDSDWDVLILLDEPVTNEKKRILRNLLYDLELQFNQIISPVIQSLIWWNNPLIKTTPFFENITKEGRELK